MKCTACGSEMATRRENYRYAASGLPVTLRTVEVRRCPKCGETGVVIPRIADLHRALALALIHKPAWAAPTDWSTLSLVPGGG